MEFGLNKWGGAGGDYGRSLAVDAAGNILLTGTFEQTADFNIGGPAVNLTSAGQSDIYIAKISPSGNLEWVKQIGGAGYEEVRSFTLDSEGNLYTTGSFNGTVDFDPGAGTANLTLGACRIYVKNSIFVNKLINFWI